MGGIEFVELSINSSPGLNFFFSEFNLRNRVSTNEIKERRYFELVVSR
jgi:hypothetical protein